MGLSIGQIPAAVAGLRASPEFGRVRLRDEAAPSPRAADKANADEPRELGFGRRDDSTPRAGFGDGTLSPQGAALRTIRRTVEEARKALPSLDDIRARFQAAAAEDRRAARGAGFGSGRAEDANARSGEDFSVRRVERRIPEAAAQARKFISDVSNAVAQANDRVGGETPRARDANPTIQIGGERVSFAGVGDRGNRPRIDLRV